jgi:hypothetical protein
MRAPGGRVLTSVMTERASTHVPPQPVVGVHGRQVSPLGRVMGVKCSEAIAREGGAGGAGAGAGAARGVAIVGEAAKAGTASSIVKVAQEKENDTEEDNGVYMFIEGAGITAVVSR